MAQLPRSLVPRAMAASAGCATVALTAAGWCLWFLSCVAKVHYDWVLEQLLPHGGITRDQQVERLRRPSPYRLVHALLHGLSSVFPKPPEARSSHRPPRAREGDRVALSRAR